MKLSVLLALTVPLAAVVQMPALADTADMAETGSWLKSSIASLKSAGKRQSSKVSHAMPVQQGAPKLRPFVPNRFLPHERDLIQSLVAQRAQVDPSNYGGGMPSPLSGEVSASYPAPYSVPYSYPIGMAPAPIPQSKATKIARSSTRSRVPRVMPGQQPVLPDQLTCKAQITPVIPDPPAPSQQMPNPPRPQFPITVPVSNLPVNTGAQAGWTLPPPTITPQEQMMLERLMTQTKPTAIMGMNGEIYGMTEDNPVNGTGPSPIPTSLISGNAASGMDMQMNPSMSAPRRHRIVPQARFGSWHQTAALPQSGFHSYIAARQPHLYSLSIAPHAGYKVTTRKTGKQAPEGGMQRQAAQRPGGAQSRRSLEPPRVALATYPTYVSANGLSY